MKHNPKKRGFRWAYLAGFLLVTILPAITFPPLFFPADWGKTITLRIILSLLLLLFSYQLLFQRHESFWPAVKNQKLAWALVAFITVFFAAVLFSVDHYFSLWGSPERGGGFINLVCYALLAVLAAKTVAQEDWQKIWDGAIIGGILVSLVALIQFYGIFSGFFVAMSRPSSTLGNPIFLGIYLMMLLFLTLTLSLNEAARPKKIYYISVSVLFFLVILLTQTIAAYIGLFIGMAYFLLFFPQKLRNIKIGTAALLILALGAVWYANLHPQLPGFLNKVRPVSSVYSRVSSINTSFRDATSRFYTWEIAFRAFRQKPLLGWGPENFAVAFDKNYDPSLPYINNASSDWWDKAHNILLDVGVQAGLFGLLAYLLLLGYVFWQLQSLKKGADAPRTRMFHGLQAMLLAYFTANLFSFDSFSTYMMYFLVIGYCLHEAMQLQPGVTAAKPAALTAFLLRNKKKALTVLLLAGFYFLWQYNFKPLVANAKINDAQSLAQAGKCDQSLAVMDSLMPQQSFLYVYSRAKYVDFIKYCASVLPDNNQSYADTGARITKEAVQIQPTFSRLWLFLGSFVDVQASYEQDPGKKEQLIIEAKNALDKADALAPNHQETIIERAKNYLVANDYASMKTEAEKCVSFYPEESNCYWMKIFSEIYLKDLSAAQRDIAEADAKGYTSDNVPYLSQLADAFSAIKDYPDLATTYERLIHIRKNVPEYHASLAFTYRELGQYRKAENETFLFLQLMPSAKAEAQAFLNTLPPPYNDNLR